MKTYWDAYLDEIGGSVNEMTVRGLLKGFYRYLELIGKIKP